MPLAACRGAAFAYEGRIAVHGLNFEVNAGDYLCIVGENGSGKSTLMKGLLRLKQPSGGSVEIGVMPREIGYLPQQTAVQRDFPAGAYEVVLSGRLGARGLRPFYSRADKTEALLNMKRLNIEEMYHSRSCCRELSAGQQQRVLLARALCAARKLLLLDEPVAGLDPVATRELYRLIADINRETGITVIMVSHDIASAVRYAGKILHLKNTQMFFGDTRDYVKSEVGISFMGTGGCHHA